MTSLIHLTSHGSFELLQFKTFRHQANYVAKATLYMLNDGQPHSSGLKPNIAFKGRRPKWQNELGERHVQSMCIKVADTCLHQSQVVLMKGVDILFSLLFLVYPHHQHQLNFTGQSRVIVGKHISHLFTT